MRRERGLLGLYPRAGTQASTCGQHRAYIKYITRLSTWRRPSLDKSNNGPWTIKQRRTIKRIRSVVNKITRITFAPVRGVITEIYVKTFLQARA